jgi:hypothetical protein
VTVQPDAPGGGPFPSHAEPAAGLSAREGQVLEPPAQAGRAGGLSAQAGSAAGPPARFAPRRRNWRRRITCAALVLALCGLAASAAGVAGQVLPRRFTLTQQRQIMAWETARRWRTERAGRIFPAVVRYQLFGAAVNSSRGLSLRAHRLGIAHQASCAAAADRSAAMVLDRLGCRTMLRATYVDSTGSMLTTVGIAVLASDAAATKAASDLSGPRGGARLLPGVRTVGYARTLASAFRDRERQFTAVTINGPYLIMTSAGFSDGRPRVPIGSDRYTEDEMSNFAVGVAAAIGAPLGAAGRVPHCPGSPGC